MGLFILESDEANFRFQELLKEAEQERLAKKVTAHRPKFQAQLLRNVGNALISLGQSMKTRSLSL